MVGGIHLTWKEIERFAAETLPASQKRRVIRHLLTGCNMCLERIRGIVLPEKLASPDYSGLMRRLELSYVVAENAVEEERLHARDVWRRMLSKLAAGDRLRAIRDSPALKTWGIFDLLLKEAKRQVRGAPVEASDLVHTALFVAESLPLSRYGEERIQDFKAAGYAALGNVKRLVGDFTGAAEALATADEMLLSGTEDPYEEAGVISIRSSLLTDLGSLEEAADLLEDAKRLARSVGDRYLEGQLTIQQSSAVGWVDPERGLHLAYEGLSLLMSSKTRDDHLELGGWHLTALWSNELGETKEARATLETYRHLYALFDDRMTEGRLLLLDALISRKEMRFDHSERLLRHLVGLYAEEHMEFDLALASLEWAESLVLLQRYDEGSRLPRACHGPPAEVASAVERGAKPGHAEWVVLHPARIRPFEEGKSEWTCNRRSTP